MARESLISKSNLSKAKKTDRVNHVGEACKRSGNFTQVPNCIFEMGLSWREREVWMFFNRLPAWDHPTIEQFHVQLGMRKGMLLDAIEKLTALNMLVVEGEGKNRRFHIPHPAYWKHEIPKSQFPLDPKGKNPIDIGNGVYSGAAVKRVPVKASKKNVPAETFQAERKQNRSGRNEKPFRAERKKQKIVPGGTKRSQQTLDNQGMEGPLNTLSQYSQYYKSPKPPLNQKSEVRGVEEEVSRDDLKALIGQFYGRYTRGYILGPVVSDLIAEAKGDHLVVREFFKMQKLRMDGPLNWHLSQGDWWVEQLRAYLSGALNEVPTTTLVWDAEPLPPETFEGFPRMPH